MITNITVLGSGVMGHGIAQNYALAGYTVHLYDLESSYLEKAIKLIDVNLSLLVKEEIIVPADKENALERIITTTDLQQATENSDFITEAVPEVLDIKHRLYNELESIIRQDTIIASNTSTFPISQLTKHIKHPERFIITHFFNPAQLVPLVEIVKGEDTSNLVVETTLNLMKDIGKSPVVLKKDIPGFIANRLQAALVREAFHLMETGVASPEDIDLAITAGPGVRWAFSGPLETADFGGLDIWKSVVENLAPDLSKAEKVPELISKKVKNGELGTKTGKGIYSYSNEVIEGKLVQRDERLVKLGKIKHGDI
ncbi:3-hydroxyacyl-CoA dehydrogenase family protein [Oceanobacillus saliphilus]|uniref:3-hydroxyacyl-CoA dehydrogenase family protein n=1 Tax=Oceanobacillus saliphilus TaxID=2925834 RepID=UPI00201D8E98|nr:3-hydroxyacyl-CoA dehydrogenase family protein [Oceanobacillus saliphilus]